MCYCFLLNVSAFFSFQIFCFFKKKNLMSRFLPFWFFFLGLGFWPSFSAWRPCLLRVGLAIPSLGKGLAIFGAGVAPSFSSLGFALPVGVAQAPTQKRVRPGPAKKGRKGRPGAQSKKGEREGQRPSQKERKGRGQARPKSKRRVRPDPTPKGRLGKLMFIFVITLNFFF